MSETLTDHYIEATARRLGCPEMWVEDCAQEMRLKLAQHPDVEYPRATARYAAIDFLRTLSHDRHHRDAARAPIHFSRLESEDGTLTMLDAVQAPDEPPSDDLLDLEAACEGMKPRTRQILGLLSMGLLQREIADRLRISEARVAQIVKGARKELAACLT